VVLDAQKIVDDLEASRRMKDVLEKKKHEAENWVNQEVTKLKEMAYDLESKTGILSENAIREKTKELQERYMKIQEEYGVKLTEVQNRLTTALVNLNDAIRATVAEIVKEKPSEYLLVIEKQALLHYNAEDDITMEVLRRLSKKKLDLAKKPVDKENR
jgi:Skp family chaperone for outer membrane proteins